MEAYQQLERDWAAWNDLDPDGMVVCSSGGAALHLAFEALNVRGRVAVPDFSMVACGRAVHLAGLEPVLVDCGQDLLVDRNLLRKVDADATLLVHVYGRRCPEPDARCVVEDLAEAHGVKPHPRSEAACWSFYRNKIVAGEEGGAVWFREPRFAQLARKLRNYGFTEAHDFDHVPRGWNYRLANCLASKVLSSMRVAREECVLPNGLIVKSTLDHRRTVEAEYDAYCPATWRMPRRDAVWVYDLRVPGMTSAQQDIVVYALQAMGVEARHGFKPLSSLQEFRLAPLYSNGVADRASREIVYLPCDRARVDAISAMVGCLRNT